MIDFSTRVEGVNEVLAALRQLPTRIENKVLRKAARNASKAVQEVAKGNVPEDTGALRKGIKVRAQKGKRGRIAFTVRTPTRAELAAGNPRRTAEIMGSRWYYPAAIEYGYTRNGVTVAPNAFMRRAYESTRDSAARAMRNELIAGLERETRILAAKRALNGGAG